MAKPITSIVDVPVRDPAAAASYYRYRRETGTWDRSEMEALAMLQETPARGAVLGAMIREIDRELGAPT